MYNHIDISCRNYVVMGIPKYFSSIIRKYPNVLSPFDTIKKTSDIQHLYIDSNSIIYDSVRTLEHDDITKYTGDDEEFERRVYDKVIMMIDSYIRYFRPSKSVYITFDGIAPEAKRAQQQLRRAKTKFVRRLLTEQGITEIGWDIVKITAGMPFMEKLSVAIYDAFKHGEDEYHLDKLYISATDEFGEGEQKIFDLVRRQNHKENIVVYGLDADLLMLSMIHIEYCQNIFVCREAPDFKGIKLFDNHGTDTIYGMNISKLGMCVLDTMNYKEYDARRLLDYCFICFFLGNDFLPHLPGVDIRTNGMEIVMKSYKNIMKNYRTKYLVGDDKITIPLFQEYIQELQSVSDKIRKNITSMQRNMIDDKDTWTKDEIDKRMFTWSIENIGEKLYENKKINQLLKLNEQTYEDVLKYYITGSYISSTSIAASSSSS